MLTFFRNIFQSKVGVAITLGLLALIAIAFATADVASTGNFGGIAGGDRVATVGDTGVDAAALRQAATSALENIKQENPAVTMEAFLAQGGLERVLDQIVDRTAMMEFGRKHGIVASGRLVDSEITKIPAFMGPDGRFSEQAFRQALQQQGVSEALVREDLAQGLVARQILVPAAFGAGVPRELVLHYASLLRERRSGAIALLPSAAFAPKTPPTEAELRAFYDRKRTLFVRPERRVIRYAAFGEEALKAVSTPTEAQVAASYKAGAAQYAALETRRLTQLIVPTEAAAQAVVAEVGKGKSLETAAREKGLGTAPLVAQTRETLARQASPAVAQAVFTAASGRLAAPARSGLGWHVIRVDAIERRSARTLDQVRGEIVQRLTAESRRRGINDLSARLEEEFEAGGNLGDAAKELGVTLQATAPLTADGRVYGKSDEMAPPELARVLQTAFAMDQENEPQLAEIEAGKTFVIFDVADITPSARAPLSEIRQDVAAAVMLEKGAAAAKSAAEKVAAQLRNRTEIGAAMASLGVPLPPVDRVDMSRDELTARQQQVPPPLVLLFSMAEGTVKLLPAGQNRGWFVAALRDIVPGKVAANDPILTAAQRELGAVSGREYAEALSRAIRADVGVKTNPAAIRAVRRQLTGN